MNSKYKKTGQSEKYVKCVKVLLNYLYVPLKNKYFCMSKYVRYMRPSVSGKTWLLVNFLISCQKSKLTAKLNNTKGMKVICVWIG